MKYFTPELYLQFNSPDLNVVEKAHGEWDDAVKRYRDHLVQISPQMTTNTRELIKSLCLHDAEYRGIEWTFLPKLDGRLGMLLLQQDDMTVFLVYILDNEPLIKEVAPWPFSRERVHWLYDEFDVHPNGGQQHEVLLSDGRVFTLRFREMSLLKVRPTETASDNRRGEGGRRKEKQRPRAGRGLDRKE